MSVIIGWICKCPLVNGQRHDFRRFANKLETRNLFIERQAVCLNEFSGAYETHISHTRKFMNSVALEQTLKIFQR